MEIFVKNDEELKECRQFIPEMLEWLPPETTLRIYYEILVEYLKITFTIC